MPVWKVTLRQRDEICTTLHRTKCNFSLDTVFPKIYTFDSRNQNELRLRSLLHSGRIDNGRSKQRFSEKATQTGSAQSAPRSVFSQYPCTFYHITQPACERDTLNIDMTRRRWIADTWNNERTTASLIGDQAQHLARVLRAEPGQIFDVIAGGFLHSAEIATVSENEVVFTLHEEMEAGSALPIHLLMAVYKFDHMEWAIEKTTELGVTAITPILARRTEKHLSLASAKRVERWRRIAREASQQSRRSDVPTINDPTKLQPALQSEAATLRILLAETEQENSLLAALQ